MDMSTADAVRGRVLPQPRFAPMPPEAQVDLLMRLAKAGQFDDLELALRLALSINKGK